MLVVIPHWILDARRSRKRRVYTDAAAQEASSKSSETMLLNPWNPVDQCFSAVPLAARCRCNVWVVPEFKESPARRRQMIPRCPCRVLAFDGDHLALGHRALTGALAPGPASVRLCPFLLPSGASQLAPSVERTSCAFPSSCAIGAPAAFPLERQARTAAREGMLRASGFVLRYKRTGGKPCTVAHQTRR